MVVNEREPQSPSKPSIRLQALINPKIHPKVIIKLKTGGRENPKKLVNLYPLKQTIETAIS